jgi:benzoyl-CoA reductase/2-hydroxyglutaryl-CoA dehydratase subunit BcrC/BadD/HgdB
MTTKGNILIYSQFADAVEKFNKEVNKGILIFELGTTDYSNLLSSDINNLMTEISKIEMLYPLRIKKLEVLANSNILIQFKLLYRGTTIYL